MDLGNIILGAIILAVCIGPLVIMYYRSVNQDNKMLQSLNEIAKQHNCNINQHEICNNFAIGLDENNNYAFFFKQIDEDSISQYVNLSEIKDCKAVKRTSFTKIKDENITFFERIELKFVPSNKSKAEISFELYTPENRQLNGELQLVDRWSTQINEHLSKK